MKRHSAKEKVASILMNLGFKVADDDIVSLHGGSHLRLNDTIERWHATVCDKDYKEVEITSAYTLTECAKGFVVEKNTAESDLYGDFIVVPKKRPACDINKDRCRCTKFEPSPAHDVFCLNCGCFASSHSNKALKGAVYTQCFTR